jgi:four helix bundle protein
MSEQAERLKARTMQFALDVSELLKHLPTSEPGPTVKRQLAKSATSVAANYRAACRARSHAEFTARIGTVAEEADESSFWLDFLAASRMVSATGLAKLQAEGRELLAIFSATTGTARRNARSGL